MVFIKVGGTVYDYAYFEETVKPHWKEQMKKEDLKKHEKK